MLKILLFVLFVLFVCDTSSISYQDLSKKYVLSAYDKIDLSQMSSNSEPGDLGSLRKSILLSRTYLDVFAYAYSSQSPDLFLILRDDLNKGYTDIGNFDDLQHVNYTSEDKDKLLNKCMKWKTSYQNDEGQYNFNRYLNSPNGNNLYPRSKYNLSSDYWGNISQVPNNNLTGYENIGLLSKGQLTNCLSQYSYIISLTEIWEEEYHDLFHDYRKLIRGINFIPNRFPEVYSGNVDKYTSVLDNAYTKFGNLNDLINEYSYYESHGYQREADKKRGEVQLMWSQLKDWMNSENFVTCVKEILNNVA